MYRLKAKKGYNVVLQDLNITLQSEPDVWYHISKESYDNSVSALKLQHLIIKEDLHEKDKAKSNKKDKAKSNEKDKETKEESKIFVKNVDEEIKIPQEEIKESKDYINIIEEVSSEEVEAKNLELNNEIENVIDLVLEVSEDVEKSQDTQDTKEIKKQTTSKRGRKNNSKK